MQSRAGKTVSQASGYLAFVPAPLPPDPPLQYDDELIGMIARAERAIGKLSGMGGLLPVPKLFVGMYVRKEALLSSQIEGIDSTLDEIISFEEGDKPSDGRRLRDTEEVVNYVRALNYGMARLAELPLCLRLVREIHAELMKGVRGEHKAPGEFRRTQNWIGPAGATLANASFVPPPAQDMMAALDALERFLHERDKFAVSVQCAIIHAQFETIHPFLDGNGRLGRLLIALILHERQILDQPLLYLSLFLKANRLEYYDRLTAVRKNGAWEDWIKFILRGMEQTGFEAAETAHRIVAFRTDALRVATEMGVNELKLLDFLFQHPLTDIQTPQRVIGIAYNTAASSMDKFAKAGLVRETTGRQRNRIFRFSGYLDLFETASPAAPGAEAQ